MLLRAISSAAKDGYIKRNNNFLYTDKNIIARKRISNPSPDLDLICDQEIIQCILIILQHQFATNIDELKIQVCKLFGMYAVRENDAQRVQKIILSQISKKNLGINDNSMVDIPKE